MVLNGRGRALTRPGDAAPARVALDEDGFTLGIGGSTLAAAYRDLDTIAVQAAAGLLVLGTGPAPSAFCSTSSGPGRVSWSASCANAGCGSERAMRS